MGCCLVAALLISLGRRAWSALTGTEPLNPFPPAARRSAPEAPATPIDRATDPAAAAGRPVPPGRPVVAAPMAAALTVVVYVGVVATLTAAGLVRAAPSPVVGSLTRDLLWAATFAALAVVGLRSRPRAAAGAGGRALAAAGGTWTALLLLDAHALGRVTSPSPALDVALHLLGLAVLYAGLLLWRPLARPVTLPVRSVGARP